MRPLVDWTAAHIFGIHHQVSWAATGSGDRVADGVTVFCLLVITVAATVVWSLLDRRRASYPRLYPACST
jgi:hypothetical protein